MYLAEYEVARPAAYGRDKITIQYRILKHDPSDPSHRRKPVDQRRHRSTLIRYAEITGLDKMRWISVR